MAVDGGFAHVRRPEVHLLRRRPLARLSLETLENGSFSCPESRKRSGVQWVFIGFFNGFQYQLTDSFCCLCLTFDLPFEALLE